MKKRKVTLPIIKNRDYVPKERKIIGTEWGGEMSMDAPEKKHLFSLRRRGRKRGGKSPVASEQESLGNFEGIWEEGESCGRLGDG